MRCVIICGAPGVSPNFIRGQLLKDDYIICADGGYAYAIAAGIAPDLIVGDFDSYRGRLDEGAEIISLQTHKDDTDSMHCAEVALQRGFKEIALLGAVGGRLDHTLGNICLLKYISERGGAGEIIDERGVLSFKAPGEYPYNNLNNRTFSVLPYGCNSVRVSYRGKVEYPARNLIISSSVTRGISNIFREDRVSIVIEEGNALVFVMRDKA